MSLIVLTGASGSGKTAIAKAIAARFAGEIDVYHFDDIGVPPAAAAIVYLPLLVDCDDETRTHRLTVERRQPELANAEMMIWATFLRREALAKKCATLDTSRLSLDESVRAVVERF